MKKEMIRKEHLVADIVKENPMSVEVMQDHGMQFIGRHIALRRTLDQATSEDYSNIHNILDELNNNIRNKL